MFDFTIKLGDFNSTTAEIIANTDEARRFLAIGDAGISITIRKSAVDQYILNFYDEGLEFETHVQADEDERPIITG